MGFAINKCGKRIMQKQRTYDTIVSAQDTGVLLSFSAQSLDCGTCSKNVISICQQATCTTTVTSAPLAVSSHSEHITPHLASEPSHTVTTATQNFWNYVSARAKGFFCTVSAVLQKIRKKLHDYSRLFNNVCNTNKMDFAQRKGVLRL